MKEIASLKAKLFLRFFVKPQVEGNLAHQTSSSWVPVIISTSNRSPEEPSSGPAFTVSLDARGDHYGTTAPYVCQPPRPPGTSTPRARAIRAMLRMWYRS